MGKSAPSSGAQHKSPDSDQEEGSRPDGGQPEGAEEQMGSSLSTATNGSRPAQRKTSVEERAEDQTGSS